MEPSTIVAISAVSGASAAILIQQQQQREEEESLTAYSEEDLVEGWEFKILRGSLFAFKGPERLQKVLQVEGRAGWVLVEKFDDSRIRLKRVSGAQLSQVGLDFDPYRTYIGPSPAKVTLFVLGTILLAIAAFVAVLLIAR